jgi:hypothetical protein
MFSSPSHPDRFWGHSISDARGSEALSPGVKQPGSEADH